MSIRKGILKEMKNDGSLISLIAGCFVTLIGVSYPIQNWPDMVAYYDEMTGLMNSHEYLNGIFHFIVVIVVFIGPIVLVGCGIAWLWLFTQQRALSRSDKRNIRDHTTLDELDPNMSIEEQLAWIDERISALDNDSFDSYGGNKKEYDISFNYSDLIIEKYGVIIHSVGQDKDKIVAILGNVFTWLPTERITDKVDHLPCTISVGSKEGAIAIANEINETTGEATVEDLQDRFDIF